MLYVLLIYSYIKCSGKKKEILWSKTCLTAAITSGFLATLDFLVFFKDNKTRDTGCQAQAPLSWSPEGSHTIKNIQKYKHTNKYQKQTALHRTLEKWIDGTVYVPPGTLGNKDTSAVSSASYLQGRVARSTPGCIWGEGRCTRWTYWSAVQHLNHRATDVPLNTEDFLHKSEMNYLLFK